MQCDRSCHIGCTTCKPKGIPACVDCEFLRRHSEGEFTCSHESCRNFDPVEGHSEMKCQAARRGGPCGLVGTLFKQRSPVPERIAGWCLLVGVALVIIVSILKASGRM